MIAAILQTSADVTFTHSPAGYWTGAVIALLILGYLVFTLVKPEKF